MSHEPFTEVLSAFIDGEAVEPEDLEAALSLPEARGILMDFARLRRSVTEDATRPSAAFYRAMEKVQERRRWWKTVPIPMPVLLGAAAVLILSLAWIGSRPRTISEHPPEAQRVVTMDWVPVGGGGASNDSEKEGS